MMAAAPAPCTARAAISAAVSWASAHAADETANTASPAAKTRRRPSRSPSAAAVISSTAKLSAEALIVHSRPAREAPRCRRIVVSAVATTSASRITRNDATEASARTHRCAAVTAGRPAVTAAQRWVLALASVASFLVILDALVVATALTTIRRHLGASLAGLEWTINASALSFAVLLMTAAALGDRLGRRRVFAAGLAVFAVSSAACALAQDTAALIAARAVQGAGAAAIMPMALALLNGAFPPGRRGWALGIYGSVT